MLYERLRDEDESWGLTRIEAAQVEKRRLRQREKKRRAAAARTRSERGLFIASQPALAPVLGEFWQTADGFKAYTESAPRILVWGLSHRTVGTLVSLPFISMQHRRVIEAGAGR